MNGGEKIQYDTCERWEFDPQAAHHFLVRKKLVIAETDTGAICYIFIYLYLFNLITS